jgi:hypothetical protein
MRQSIGAAAEFYRQLMRRLSGAEVLGDDQLAQAVAAARHWWVGDGETAAACLERCWDAEAHVHRNANQATLLDGWLDDLAQMTQTGRQLARSW